MKYCKLNNNLDMPYIGFGTWKLKNETETENIIENAIKTGYALIDTAYSYGNEEVIGNVIKKMTDEQREELFISGKLWNTDKESKESIINACKRTIKNLNCKYLDLYLVHWPASPAVHDDWKEINKNTWEAMEYLYENGFVKAIGVCNFKKNQLEELLKSAKIKPMVNQIEFHIGFMQKETLDFCKENNIVVQGWSPLGSGKMFRMEELSNLAEKYNTTVAKVCLRWCLQNGVIPIPKSKRIERMKENIDIFNFEISKEDMEYLNSIPYKWGSGLDSETITIFN